MGKNVGRSSCTVLYDRCLDDKMQGRIVYDSIEGTLLCSIL